VYPSGTGCYCSIGHAAGTLKASGHEAINKENDHAYERPSAEYPDGTRPSFRTGAAGGKPGDRHADGNENRTHREYPALGWLSCARCCCCLTQCQSGCQPGGRCAYRRQGCSAEDKVTCWLHVSNLRVIHPHMSMVSRRLFAFSSDGLRQVWARPLRPEASSPRAGPASLPGWPAAQCLASSAPVRRCCRSSLLSWLLGRCVPDAGLAPLTL
jgi:hypothetical protein